MNQHNTFAEDIEKAAMGDSILAIRIEDSERVGWGWSGDGKLPPELVGRILLWEKVRPHLNYEYDAGYGSQDCHDITAWTENRVLFVHEYDGSTYIRTVDRNPTEGPSRELVLLHGRGVR